VKIGNAPKADAAKNLDAAINLAAKVNEVVVPVKVADPVKANAVVDRADHPRDDPAQAAPDSEVDVAPEIWDPAGSAPVPSCESCLCSLPWTPTPTENCPLPKSKMLPKH
jgi:hypothetical protein